MSCESPTTATMKTPSMGRRPKDPDLTTYRGRFAARLRELRQAKFATQGEFVDALNNAGFAVIQATVSSWERGDSTPDLDWWPVIAATLGTSIQKLVPAQ